MSAKVILDIVAGPQEGQSITFDEAGGCLIGRGKDCAVRLPNDDDHRLVSRHHCLLDVNPPDVRIRDLGSRNGTWVNGTKIGQRPTDRGRDDAEDLEFPEQELKDGDEFRVGRTVFRVTVIRPPRCCACGTVIVDTVGLGGPGKRSFFCGACLSGAPNDAEALPPFRPRCAHCGRDVTEESGADRPGAYVCDRCHNDPLGVMNHLVSRAEHDPADLAALAGYRVIRELGRGGMGAVYLAEHRSTGEQVALKLMLPRVAADERATQRFLREARTVATLKHTNVVSLRDFGACEGAFYLTLDYCERGNLLQWVHRRGEALPIPEAWGFLTQILDALTYTHSVPVDDPSSPAGGRAPRHGLVHRDLKPSNVFLSGPETGPTAKLGDYGLAKAFDLAGLSGYTRTGMTVGTPRFLPRQQVLNFKYAKPEVDVWAAAAIFYYMITAAAPRDFPPNADPCRVVLETPAAPVRRRNQAVPAKLAEVVDAALIDNPKITFQTAGELRAAIEGAL